MSDETLNHPAVKMYRDIFKFCPNLGFRKEIILTVTDLDLWKSILSTWGFSKDGKWKSHNPLNVKGLMSEYERRAAKHTERSNATDRSKRDSLPNGSEARVSEWRNGNLSRLRQGTRVHNGADSKTLDEILTGALRAKDRP
jgi:hypothetical protein